MNRDFYERIREKQIADTQRRADRRFAKVMEYARRQERRRAHESRMERLRRAWGWR